MIPVTRETENLPPNAIFETIETPKKPPGQKIFQEDQMKPVRKYDVIKYLDDINKEKMKSASVVSIAVPVLPQLQCCLNCSASVASILQCCLNCSASVA